MIGTKKGEWTDASPSSVGKIRKRLTIHHAVLESQDELLNGKGQGYMFAVPPDEIAIFGGVPASSQC